MVQPLADLSDAFVIGENFNANGPLPYARQHHVHVRHRRQQPSRRGIAGECLIRLDFKIEPRDAG